MGDGCHREFQQAGVGVNVASELAAIGAYGGFFTIATGGRGDDWRPVMDSYANGFVDLIEATAAQYGTTDLRIGASLVQFSFASRLWSPAIACGLRYGIVPDYIGLQHAADSPALRLPDPTGVCIDDEDRLPATLYEIVVRQHLEPLAQGLRVKIAPGLLYGNIASALVAATRALYAIQPDLRARATTLARELLETHRLAGTGTVRYNLAFRRRSCCLYYRIANGSKCGDCGLSRRNRDVGSLR